MSSICLNNMNIGGIFLSLTTMTHGVKYDKVKDIFRLKVKLRLMSRSLFSESRRALLHISRKKYEKKKKVSSSNAKSNNKTKAKTKK